MDGHASKDGNEETMGSEQSNGRWRGGDKELAFRIFQILPRTLPLPLGFTGLCVRASGRSLS